RMGKIANRRAPMSSPFQSCCESHLGRSDTIRLQKQSDNGQRELAAKPRLIVDQAAQRRGSEGQVRERLPSPSFFPLKISPHTIINPPCQLYGVRNPAHDTG